ncbi:MAG: septation protein SepH, partial [Dermatophilaceae bacterium]
MTMQDLQLIGVHEDGEHLLLRGAEGAHFRMPVDEPLRAA